MATYSGWPAAARVFRQSVTVSQIGLMESRVRRRRRRRGGPPPPRLAVTQ